MSRSTFLSVLGALIAVSCVRAPAHVRHARVHAKIHTYQVPLEEVWPYALQLLTEQGYAIEKNEARDEGARFSAETRWAMAGSQQLRIIVSGKSYADSSSQVSFTRQQRYLGQSQMTLERDLDLEWALLRLVDPESAAAIQGAGPQPAEE